MSDAGVKVGDERFLVIGLGSIGRRHAANLRQLRPGCLVAALRLVGGGPPAPDVSQQFDTWRDALAFLPDAAFICNPAPRHLEAARILLDAGIPMLIEKPVADRIAELSEFIVDVRRANIPVAVGYNLRFTPALVHARAALLGGAIGRVVSARAEVGQYLPDWRPQSRYQDGVSARRALGGGPLLELSHELDYLYWMFGLPTEVFATGASLGGLEIDVEDTVELVLAYKEPARLFNVHLDFLQRTPDRRCRFIGTEGTLAWDAMRETVSIFRASDGRWEHVHQPAADHNQVYLDELSAFFRLMAGEAGQLATLEDAYGVLAIVEAATGSMATRTAVRLHEPA